VTAVAAGGGSPPRLRPASLGGLIIGSAGRMSLCGTDLPCFLLHRHPLQTGCTSARWCRQSQVGAARPLPLCRQCAPRLLWAADAAAVVVAAAVLHLLSATPFVPRIRHFQLPVPEVIQRPSLPCHPPTHHLPPHCCPPYCSNWVQCGDCDLQEHQISSVGPGWPDQHPPLLAVLLPVSWRRGACWGGVSCAQLQLLLRVACSKDSMVQQGCLSPITRPASACLQGAPAAALAPRACANRADGSLLTGPVPCPLCASPCPPVSAATLRP
jgi:hypothetical protein